MRCELFLESGALDLDGWLTFCTTKRDRDMPGPDRPVFRHQLFARQKNGDLWSTTACLSISPQKYVVVYLFRGYDSGVALVGK